MDESVARELMVGLVAQKPMLKNRPLQFVVLTCSLAAAGLALLALQWTKHDDDDEPQRVLVEPMPADEDEELPPSAPLNEPEKARESEIATTLEKKRVIAARDTKNPEKPVVLVTFGTECTESRINNEDLALLQGLPRLESILINGKHFPERGLEHVGRLKRLRELQIRSVPIASADFKHLNSLVNLRLLSISSPRYDGTGLECVGGMKKLRKLHLFGSDVSDANLKYVEGVTSLRELTLPTTTTDDGLKHLRGLKYLRKLYIHGRISDEGLKHLEGLQHLRTLYLQAATFDEGLEHLRPLIGLEELYLPRTVSDRGLKYVRGMKNLRVLVVGGSQVTDSSVKHLATLTNLRELFLGRTKISRSGMRKLRSALPKTHIRTPDRG